MKRSLKCTFFQWRISSALDSDGGEAKLPVRHIARCAACREFHERSVALGESLREAAATVVAGDVVCDVSRRNHGTRPVSICEVASGGRARRRRWAWGAVATVAAAAILLVVLTIGWKGGSKDTTVAGGGGTGGGNPVHENPPSATQPSPEDAARALAAISDPIGTLKRHARGPIDRRIDSLRADAQAAGRAIASLLPIEINGEKREP